MSGPAARRALAAPLALVAGCGGGAEPAPRASATPAAPVQRVEPTNEELIGDLLRDRAAALEAGDTRAYAATAGGTQPRRDRASGRRARLPLRDVSIDLETLDVRGGRATARVTTSYSIAGIRGDFQAERRVTAVRAGGRWRVGRMAGGRGVPPWEVGEFVARRTPHFVLLAPAGLDVGDLPEALEAGYATMQDLLVRGLRRRYLVVVAADALQARALTIEIRGIEPSPPSPTRASSRRARPSGRSAWPRCACSSCGRCSPCSAPRSDAASSRTSSPTPRSRAAPPAARRRG